jgi:hypothetical protein
MEVEADDNKINYIEKRHSFDSGKTKTGPYQVPLPFLKLKQ